MSARAYAEQLVETRHSMRRAAGWLFEAATRDTDQALNALSYAEQDLREAAALIAAARAALRGPVRAPDENEEEVVF